MVIQLIIYFSQSLQLYIKKKEVNLELLFFNIYIYKYLQ